MAYSELIKNFEKIREYMREFYVYGFKQRDQYQLKSKRQYDNQRRRVESWLMDYVSYRQESSGKIVYLSVDNRTTIHNPLYLPFKAKSFTANDITLHFYLMDILENGKAYSAKALLNKIATDYLNQFEPDFIIDESTLRKKINEYVKIGLIECIEEKKLRFYKKSNDYICLEKWADALAFYSETDAMGVIGSFLLDKLTDIPEYFQFKHHFLLQALDSEIMCSLLTGMSNGTYLKLRIPKYDTKTVVEQLVFPLRIYLSRQTGRQYVFVWEIENNRPAFYRLDHLLKAEQAKIASEEEKAKQTKIASKEEKEIFERHYERVSRYLWGVSIGDGVHTEHLEMLIHATKEEYFIVNRLEREKRNGRVEQISPEQYLFVTDVYDATEMLPWIRTFTGRILKLSCSNPEVTEKFKQDLASVYTLYLDDND